jgi:hypothetical protein
LIEAYDREPANHFIPTASAAYKYSLDRNAYELLSAPSQPGVLTNHFGGSIKRFGGAVIPASANCAYS